MISRYAADLGWDITCIDTGLFGPQMAACYLVRGGGEAAIIDTGSGHSVDRVLAVIDALGIGRESVRYVMPTHVHLDHASGSGGLMQRLPGAQLVIHPRGARHMADPRQLWASAAGVYGAETLLRDYGHPVPVPEERMILAGDGFEVRLGGRRLLVLDTPGHARHHYSVWDEVSRGFFTGDTFGVSYRQTDSRRGPFILATTTPVQFDPDAWLKTLDRYAAFRPERVYLTHYGMVEHLPRLLADLRADVEAHARIAQQCAGARDVHGAIKAALMDHTLRRLSEHGTAMTEAEQRTFLDMDMDLNAHGLAVWLERERKQQGGG